MLENQPVKTEEGQMEKFLLKQAAEADEVLFQAKRIREESQKLLVKINTNSQDIISTTIRKILFVSIVSLLLLVGIFFFTIRTLTQPILKLATALCKLILSFTIFLI